MTEFRIIRVRNREDYYRLPMREVNRAHVIIVAGRVHKARHGSGFVLGSAA